MAFTSLDLNWTKLGNELRQSAEDAHGLNVGGELPSVELAYDFLLNTPELFIDQTMLDGWNATRPADQQLTMSDVEIGNVSWPADMPVEPNNLLRYFYYNPAALDAA